MSVLWWRMWHKPTIRQQAKRLAEWAETVEAETVSEAKVCPICDD